MLDGIPFSGGARRSSLEEIYDLVDGRRVSIAYDEDEYSIEVRAVPNGERIGGLRFRCIEMDDPPYSYLHLTWAYLDELDATYLHKGIGQRCIELVLEWSGLSITASVNDGNVRSDGSHLTGDAPAFIEKMRALGLVGTSRS